MVTKIVHTGPLSTCSILGCHGTVNHLQIILCENSQNRPSVIIYFSLHSPDPSIISPSSRDGNNILPIYRHDWRVFRENHVV